MRSGARINQGTFRHKKDAWIIKRINKKTLQEKKIINLANTTNIV